VCKLINSLGDCESKKKVWKLGSGDFIACFSMQILKMFLGNGHRCELNKVIIKVA